MAFLMIFRRFPTTFRGFSNIFQNCSKSQANVPEHFSSISEDVRRLRRWPKTFEGDPKMFRWYTNEFKYKLRDKLDISEIIDKFTCEDIISLHVRIWYRFHQFVRTRYTTDFYITFFYWIASKTEAEFELKITMSLFIFFSLKWASVVTSDQYLRNRKHVPCFYRVIQTRVEVWENEKCCGNTSRRRVFPQLFRVLPNFHEYIV